MTVKTWKMKKFNQLFMNNQEGTDVNGTDFIGPINIIYTSISEEDKNEKY